MVLIPGFSIRSEFPLFSQDATPRAYLDTANSSLKPRSVVDRISHYFAYEHANIHRGAYALSAHATELYDAARCKVAGFIGAASERSVIFTRGTTESINLVAHAIEHAVHAGDAIVLTKLEHHSNIVPWQLMAERRGAVIHFAEITPQATIETESLVRLIGETRPKIVAVTLLSNAFGSITDWEPVVKATREVGALLLADAAQAVVHIPVNVQKLDVDFLAFSGHKIYGPTGVGVLYVREGAYEVMRPFMGGGDMIERVTIMGSTYAQPPQMFEAGTPPIGEAVGLGAAIEFIEQIGVQSIARHEDGIVAAAIEQLRAEPGVTVLGPGDVGRRQSSIVSFNVAGVHAHDIASVADSFNVQIRAGTHCAMPALDSLGIGSTARLSVGVYSCTDDIEQLLQAIRETRRLFL